MLQTAHPILALPASSNLLVRVARKLMIAACVPPYMYRKFLIVLVDERTFVLRLVSFSHP